VGGPWEQEQEEQEGDRMEAILPFTLGFLLLLLLLITLKIGIWRKWLLDIKSVMFILPSFIFLLTQLNQSPGFCDFFSQLFGIFTLKKKGKEREGDRKKKGKGKRRGRKEKG